MNNKIGHVGQAGQVRRAGAKPCSIYDAAGRTCKPSRIHVGNKLFYTHSYNRLIAISALTRVYTSLPYLPYLYYYLIINNLQKNILALIIKQPALPALFINI